MNYSAANDGIGMDIPEPLLARLSNPNLRFPRLPLLVPDLHVFTMPDGLGIQFRGGRAPVVLRGPAAQKVMTFLLPVLNGAHEVAQILNLRPPDITAIALARVLSLMHSKGLLIEGGKQALSSTDVVGPGPVIAADLAARRQLMFWGRHLDVTRSARYTSELQQALGGAQVVILANGLFGTAACDLLIRSGCSDLQVIAWDDDGMVRQSIGATTAEVIHLDTRSVDSVSNILDARLPTADLVVTAIRNGSSAFFRAINRLCLEYRRPWLRGNFDGRDFEIGPYIYPYDSSCYRCLELREASAMESAIEEQLYQQQLSSEIPAGMQPPLGEALFAATLGASLLIAEVVRATTNVAPVTLIDQVLRVSAAEGAIDTARVLRVPRCPDCYQGATYWEDSDDGNWPSLRREV